MMPWPCYQEVAIRVQSGEINKNETENGDEQKQGFTDTMKLPLMDKPATLLR